VFATAVKFESRAFFYRQTNSMKFTARWFVWSSCLLWIFSARLEHVYLLEH